MKQYKPITHIKKLYNNKGYSVRIKYKNGGKWEYSKRVHVHGNKQEAIEKAYELFEKLTKNQTNYSGTLKELVEDYKSKREVLGKVSNSTLKRDETEYARIIQYLGNKKAVELTATVIENAYVEMAKEGVSKDAIHKTHLKLKKILDLALRDDKITKNPCFAIEGISRPKKSIQKKKETRFTKDMYFKLIDILKNEEISGNTVVLWLAVNTGMRRGEILGLKWKYVKFDKDNPSIKIAYSYSKEKELKAPKTENSKRVIAIDKNTVAYLKKWQSIQKAYLDKIGVAFNTDTPVCTNEFGAFLDPNNFNRWRRAFFVENGFAKFKSIKTYMDNQGNKRTKKIGYVGPNLHSLRHTQATLLVGANIDPKTVQARLGHSRISTTLEIYAEALEENDKIAANYMETLIKQN